jgi:hypothetical protein
MSSPTQPIKAPPAIPGPTIDNPHSSDAVAGRASGATSSRYGDPAAGPAATAIGDVGTFIEQLAAGVSALEIDASRVGPPPEVLDQVAVAGRIGEQLREAGHELRFFPSSEGGRVRIEVHDRDGNTLGTLSPTAALELAAGSPLN